MNEDTQLRSPSGPGSYDDQIFQRLLKERIIFLGTPVEDSVANILTAQMLVLAAEDPEKDIYDTMQYIPNDVATVAMGLAASMGQFLLSAGAKGKRYALPHARIMMHQPSGGIGGTASDIKIQAEQMLHIKKQMARLIAEHTGQTADQIEQDSDRDRWFTADDAKVYGFVDKVVRSASDVTGHGGTR